MNIYNKFAHLLSGPVAGTVLLTFLGCGADDGLESRYPVSGKVTYKGEKVKTGSVSFVPADVNSGRAAGGEIQDGYYSLTTLTPGDGAMSGKYKVSIISENVDLSKAFAEADGGALPEAAVAKARRKSLIPRKYGSVSTSDMTAEVKAERNSIDFDLKD